MKISTLFSHLTVKYCIVMPLVAKLPQEIAYRLISYYARMQLPTLQSEHGSVCEQMSKVLIDKSEAELNQIADYFLCMAEREKLDTEFFQKIHKEEEIDQFVRLHNVQPLLGAREQGRRVMITTGHFGRFWMTGIGLQRYGVSVGTITRDRIDANNQQLPEQEFNYRVRKLKALQKRLGGPFLEEGDAVRPIYKALDEFVMALLIDVPYVGPKSGCIELPFLGQPSLFPTGIARIAQKTNALIFPYYTHESRAGLDVEFFPALEAKHLSESEIMKHLVTLLESQILMTPEQWWLWQALPLLRN